MVVSRLKANTGGCAVVDGVPLSSAGVPLVEGGAVPLYAHIPRLTCLTHPLSSVGRTRSVCRSVETTTVMRTRFPRQLFRVKAVMIRFLSRITHRDVLFGPHNYIVYPILVSILLPQKYTEFNYYCLF